MKIICPKCNSAYNLDKKNLPKNGRKLKCFICESIWIQHPSGEAEKVKNITDFIDEIKTRQDAIKSSLETNTPSKKPSEKLVKPSLNKDQEREFLEVLAIGEIQENRRKYKSLQQEDSSTKEQLQDIDLIKGKPSQRLSLVNFNRTFLGFLLVSTIFLPILTLILNRNVVLKLNLPYQEHILVLLRNTDVLVDRVQLCILILQDYIFSYF